MPKLSSYSNLDYPDGEEQIMPWEFWTDEERSLVIKESYKDLELISTRSGSYPFSQQDSALDLLGLQCSQRPTRCTRILASEVE